LGGPGALGGQGRPGGTFGGFPGGTPPSLGAGTGQSRGLGQGFGGGLRTGGAPGAGSGFLNASTPGKSLVALITRNAAHYKWAAATINSNSAAGYQLATGDAVMAIGGFNGTDPTPTLSQFEKYVAKGEIHYFISSSGGFGGGGGVGGASTTTSTSSQITSWVESHYTAKTVDGVTLYDLTATAKS
jgi:hypothetical protein